MNRTSLYKTAVIVHTLNSLFMIAANIPALIQGLSAEGTFMGVPQVVWVLSALMGVAGLISAYGAWQGQKWGVWLTVVVEAVNGIMSLPGVLFAPVAWARIWPIASVLIALFVIVALLRRPKAASSI